MVKKDVWETTQGQLTDLYRKSQDALVSGVETWAKATRELLDAASIQADPKNVESTIDQAFTTATAALDEQRALVKRLYAAAMVSDES